MIQYFTHSSEETMEKGYQLGSSLHKNDIVCFMGELAAGKTTFIKGLVAGAAQFPKERVNSPTFVYMNIYQGQQTIYHFDLYRLKDTTEFLNMGFDDSLFAGGICCIEWAERILPILPQDCIFVKMSHAGENSRLITVTKGLPILYVREDEKNSEL